nr:MAG TPA: hypothetical protein [Caudoviricetes sp.]
MKGYKGFKKGLICKGKQYAENTVFEEEEAVICENGMHFCKNPFDVLDYYGFVDEKGSMNEFAEVEALAETDTNDNKKYCTTKLKVGAKLSFAGFVKTCVDFVLEKTTVEIGDAGENKIGSSGDYAKIGSSGYSAKIGSSGDYAQICSTGEDSVICCAGHNSIVKAKKGSWITLSEWEYSEEKKRVIPLCVKTEYVDGERIKADTFYRLVKGEFKEVN